MIFASCKLEQKSKGNIVTEAENYQIYSRAFEEEKKSHPITRKLKISKITQATDIEVWGLSEKDVNKELWSAMTDYSLKNKTPISLEPKFTISDSYDFFAPDELQLQEGMRVFSQIGYNSEKTLAFVYTAFSCEPLCGHGNYYIFSKKNDNWELKEIQQGWVS
jgi:hypothetical protein